MAFSKSNSSKRLSSLNPVQRAIELELESSEVKEVEAEEFPSLLLGDILKGRPESVVNFLSGGISLFGSSSKERILFCNDIKTRKYNDGHSSTNNAEEAQDQEDMDLYYKFDAPEVQTLPVVDTSQRPGHVPLSTAFHMQSNRERQDDNDDGLDDADLTAADGINRDPRTQQKKAVEERRASKRHSFIYEAIRMVKGDFVFPHRTYRPKVQVPFRVPPGHLPQAVVIERLHRHYRKADINALCNSLGITVLDLQAVPHYGENNERFYQEMQWRNRIRVNGVDKRDYIQRYLNVSKDGDNDEGTNSDSKGGKHHSKNRSFQGESYGEEYDGEMRDDKQDEFSSNNVSSNKDDEEVLPPFGPMFPLDYFDNEEYDIRSGEEWMYLGWDWKEQKIFPIPAKAFLPMPKDSTLRKKKCHPNTPADDVENVALSELTSANLLTKTERLEKFRRWLLTERYRRLVRDGEQKDQLEDADLVAFARATTTVPNLQPLLEDDDDVDHDHGKAGEGMMTSSSLLSIKKLFSGETDGEHLGDSFSVFDIIHGGQSDFLEQFKKVEKTEEAKTEVEKVEVKRSESLLQAVFSDPCSSIVSPEESAHSNLENKSNKSVAGDVGKLVSEDLIQDYQNDAFTKPSGSSEAGLNPQAPNSPDIDPYEDGFEELVYDYDKMKRVHNYDWKWVDVAVFKFDGDTRRYFIRTISPPYLFAWIGKLYLLMDGEDPRRHAERIKDAIKRRHEVENIMRYNLYVDCLPMERSKHISTAYMRIILVKVLETPRLDYNDKTIRRIQREIDLEYQRTHQMLEFNDIVEKHPKLYLPWVKIPPPFVDWGNGSEWKRINSWRVDTGSFTYKKTRIQKLSVIYQKEPYEGLVEIVTLCLTAREKSLLLTRQSYATSLDPYEAHQVENIIEVITYLRSDWMSSILETVTKHLSKIPHSWYNIKETQWDVFLMSKTCNYLTLVKFIMEDTLRFITEGSLKEFVGEIEALTEKCAVDHYYDWGEDLIKSEFPPPESMVPPFMLELVMDKEGPRYSQLLAHYPKMVASVFDKAVHACSSLPDVVPQIMANLLFGVNRHLQGVEDSEHHIKQLKSTLLRCIRKGLLPVDRYAQKYKRYQAIWNLDLPHFLRKFEEEGHTAAEVRKAVEAQQAELNKIEEEIPVQVDITCFRVVTDVVKQNLLKKKKGVITGILDQFAVKLRNAVQKIRDEYQEMERKLNNRSDDIQEVMELKLYIETVPGQVQRNSELMTKLMKDYEVFEKFSYLVPNDDFEAKWNTALWSSRILKIAEEAVTWLDDDYDRLLKVQQADMSALSDSVDSASLAVAGLAAYVELEKAIDVSQEVKKIWKQVKELKEQNRLLNTRQQIFGLPSTQNEALERLIRDIEPFRSLWFTAADMLRLQEIVYKETLDKIDMRAVNKLINEGSQTIRRCIRYFKGADAIQHIAEEVKHCIDDFKRIVPLISTFKNQGMRQRHWEAVSDACGFTVVAKGNQNFKALLEQGIAKNVDEIASIGELATNEFAIETKMERMQRELNRLKMENIVDPTSGLTIIQLAPSKAMNVIEDFIRATADLQQNLYKTPFEERLNLWEKKIVLTKENIVMWFDCQKEWVKVQPFFTTPDAATRMPPEYKMFVKMERIWRRLNRLVRDTPEILEIGSDSTVRASLLQFSGLITKVNKGLEEYMRPQGSSSDDDANEDAEGSTKRSVGSSTAS
ncbi:unnamed protein product [Allacma fusca]|uniref:Dynein heavy chain linker domain-containing protein n=1 Tax=Allacma fusca TaxID=39272 RepID=A0A8J2L9M5_9HEXA|nr:unnamed protein product [Allacma fusca]